MLIAAFKLILDYNIYILDILNRYNKLYNIIL